MKATAIESARRIFHVGCIVACVLSLTARGATNELPRKSKTPREEYPNVDVVYDFVTAPHGERLRTIITKPHDAIGKLPVIFLAAWLSCDTVEAPPGKEPGPDLVRHDATGLALRELAQLCGFASFRMDKQGCGDSEGNCAETDFESELAGYRAAFRALKNYDFIDTNQVYILGISNGGGFAPLVPETEAEQNQVRGYVVVGGWVKTWFEHMLEIERRRFGLMGKSPGDVNQRMKGAATLYEEWLIKNKNVDQILRENPRLAELWPEGKDHAHLYGRPLAFYQQLQKLNLAAAWSRVKVPALILHGQFDWIMSREDHELIAQYVNANQSGAARFVEVSDMGHTFQHYLNFADAVHGKEAPFDRKPVQLIIDWVNQQQPKISAKDHRGLDLISDALLFGGLWYRWPNAVSNAIGYAMFRSRSDQAVIRVYNAAGNVIEAHEHPGDFKER